MSWAVVLTASAQQDLRRRDRPVAIRIRDDDPMRTLAVLRIWFREDVFHACHEP